MAVYMIVSQSSGTKLRTSIREAYPLASEFWGDNAGLIYTNDSAKEVGENIGIAIYDNGTHVSGDLTKTLIIEVSRNYFGAGPKTIWSWLQAAFKEDQAND